MEFEIVFNHSIGVYSWDKKRGHHWYAKIKEETDPVLKGNWPYFVVTLLVGGHWRIPGQNGPSKFCPTPNRLQVHPQTIKFQPLDLKSTEKIATADAAP